ncbi:MAG TPA: cobyric acid synthase [Candidatus Nitrosopolaris sp.]|nr:cobyric acid synthase [Candidatus Nitrosopolaris sp.]
MIQGTSSGVGKSTIVMGLCRIFSDLGYCVAPFKAQNMSSNIHIITEKSESKEIALAQAIQAEACRKRPDVKMNPILIKPLGSYRSRVILNGICYTEMHAKEYYETFTLQKGFPIVIQALENLRVENDIVVIEGAGSPSEINISKYDIANMLLAKKVEAPVIVVTDIERGGCFASIVGTLKLLKPQHRSLIRGFLINKFRGDPSILESALKSLEKITQKKNFGVIPKLAFNLPAEDSLDSTSKVEIPSKAWSREIDIVANSIKNTVPIEEIMRNVVGLDRI